jgi:serine/threonine-protein kinase
MASRLAYRIMGDFAVGGVARLYKVALADGSAAILRELQTSKLLNLRLQCRFSAGAACRSALSPPPTIVNSFEAGRRFLVPYEIIEFVNGISLRTLLNRNEPRLKQDAPELLRQMALGLAWVHEHGYMHLDVKPENFLIQRTDSVYSVKLTDFDLCRRADDCWPRRQMGTPSFMAPEQFKEKRACQASDVFAFGVIAYQLLTGQRPFSGSTEKSAWRSQASFHTAPRPPRELNPQIPPKLEAVVLGCLRKPLKERYHDMSQVLQSLNRC